MAAGVSARLSAQEGRRFGLTLGTAMAGFAAGAWLRGHPTTAAVLVAAGFVLIATGLIAPSRLGPTQRAWTALGAALSRIMTPVVLGFIYFVIITPAGLVRRLAGRNPLARRPSTRGFWVRRAAGRSRHDMEHLF